MTDYLSVWTFIRASGFLAFYFMTFSLAFGLLSSFTVLKKKKATILTFHQTSGWLGLLTTLFHMLLIWQDQYVPYSLGELLLPFIAKNDPVFSAFGTISFYLFFVVIGSSDFFIKRLGIKRWKKVHLAVIPAWVLMVIHGLAIGTDSSEPWAMFIYASAISIMIVLGFIRYMETLMVRQTAGRK